MNSESLVITAPASDCLRASVPRNILKSSIIFLSLNPKKKLRLPIKQILNPLGRLLSLPPPLSIQLPVYQWQDASLPTGMGIHKLPVR